MCIWFAWRDIDRGHFDFLLNGCDIDIEIGNSDQAAPPHDFTWVMDKKPKRKKSFIGSFMSHHRYMTVSYVRSYIVLEIIIFVVAGVQILFDNWVMNGHFIYIGFYHFERLMTVGTKDRLMDIFRINFDCDMSEFAEKIGPLPDYTTTCVLNLNWFNEIVVSSMWVMRVLSLGVASWRMGYWFAMSIPEVRRRTLIRKWCRTVNTGLVTEILRRTTFAEHVLLNAIFGHSDVDKFTNILLQIQEDIPAANDITLSRRQRRITDRDYSV
jgi:hypothetical protein